MVITIIGLACLGYLLAVAAEPAQDIKEYFNLHIDAVYRNKFQWFFVKMLNCCLCFSFWLGLSVTLNISVAAIVSVLSEIICRLMKKL